MIEIEWDVNYKIQAGLKNEEMKSFDMWQKSTTA